MKAAVRTILLSVFLAGGPAVQALTAAPAAHHYVRRGDTLAHIALRYYGDPSLYGEIARANKLTNPHLIITGTSLVLPVLPIVSSAPVQMTAVKPAAIAPEPANSSPAVPVPEPASPAAVIATPPADAFQGAPAAFVWRQEQNTAFSAGERLVFEVRWKFITVGSAVMELKGGERINDRDCLRIVTEARSAPFFDSFYRVRDVNESWMDAQSLCSHKFVSQISENGESRLETILFDQMTRSFSMVEKDSTGPTPAWVQDVLSALYYLRTRPLGDEASYVVDAQSGDTSWPLTVRVTGRERIKVPAGEFDCFVVEPALREGAGIFNAKGKLWVWLTSDEKHMPVLMRSKIAVGSIEARLVSFQEGR